MNEAPFDKRIFDLIIGFLAQVKDEAIVFMDAQGMVIGWTGGAEHVLGYSEAEVLGMSIARIFTDEDRAKGLHAFELEVARTSVRSEDDRWHVRKDGSHIWVTGTVTAVRDRAGEVVGFVKIMRDRTDLRSQIETLENRLEAALQKQESIGLFLSTLGHEMRNPLSPLATAVELIELQGKGTPLTRPLGIIRRQIAVLQRLADDLVDIARLGTSKLELRMSTIDLQALLSDSVAGLQGKARDKGVRLQAVLPAAPIELIADGDRLQQVVLNLIDNALKYTPPGGTVWVKAIEEGNEAVVRVEDTGIGIPPELLPRVFELFTQGSLSAPGTNLGLGIGLALARDLVEQHGGVIEARSAGVDKGSHFTVRIPLKPDASLALTLP